MLKTGGLVFAMMFLFYGSADARPGDLDLSFNAPSGLIFYEPGTSGNGVAVQEDGKIVVAGTATYDAPDLVVLRYTAQGLLDDTFGVGGVFRYNGPAKVYADVATAVAIAPNGKIVVVGNSAGSSSDTDIVTLRLIGQELLMLPTTDALIPYPPTAEPLLSADPFTAKPVGVGPVAEGVNVLELRVGLSALAGPVDLYLALCAPHIDPDVCLIIRSDNVFQPHTAGLIPWRSNIEGPLMEELYGPIPLDGLPGGTYFIYFAVIPNSSAEGYYLWQTSFAIP